MLSSPVYAKFHPRQIPKFSPGRSLSSLFSLFAPRVFHNSFPIKRFRTLSKNCRVYGGRSHQFLKYYFNFPRAVHFAPTGQKNPTICFQPLTNCPFSISFVLTFIHVMGGCTPPLSALFCVPCASALSFSPSFAPKKKKGGGRNHRLAPPRSDSVELF
jgi:hypothetical protein